MGNTNGNEFKSQKRKKSSIISSNFDNNDNDSSAEFAKLRRRSTASPRKLARVRQSIKMLNPFKKRKSKHVKRSKSFSVKNIKKAIVGATTVTFEHSSDGSDTNNTIKY